MSHRLLRKFLLTYALIGAIGLIFISMIGSSLIKSDLTRQTGNSLYKEAVTIASLQAKNYYSSQATLSETYDSLSTLASYQSSQIWMIDPEGTVLLDTSRELEQTGQEQIESFDPVSFGSKNYTVGMFFHSFHTQYISVLAPITVNMSTRGYIAIHIPISTVDDRSSELLRSFYLIFLIIFSVSFAVMLFVQLTIYRPVKQITQGAKEYASGNLPYNIPVKSDDELGYLAATLNYMSDELAKSGEYQKKFISNVSHDFRSPLTSIKGFIEAIKDGTIPPELQDHYLDIVLMETERLNKLTESLLTLNELDVDGSLLVITDFDINNVIRDTAASFEGSCLKKHITIELALLPEALLVTADKSRIQQVLYNLIDNAIKFSENNSSIKVETSERYGKIFISVKDNGSGIAKEAIPKIWNRFYKQDASRGKDRKGTGLGLSIVKEIINSHNENINVISTEGVGTEFIFTLSKAKKS